MMNSRQRELGANSMVERNAVRAAVLDRRGRLLLLHTRDLGNAAFGQSWELPGGGIEPGETPFEAVIRELQEEVGIRVDSATLNPPTWHRDVIYTYRGERRLQHEVVFLVQLDELTPPIVTTQRLGFEPEDHFESRWWTIEEVAANRDRFYPRSLPCVIKRFVEGDQIHEDLEVWD